MKDKLILCLVKYLYKINSKLPGQDYTAFILSINLMRYILGFINCTEGVHMYDGHFVVAFLPIMCAGHQLFYLISFHLNR